MCSKPLSTDSEMCSISLLPNEIIQQILLEPSLELTDITNFGLTCHKFYQFVKNNLNLFKLQPILMTCSCPNDEKNKHMCKLPPIPYIHHLKLTCCEKQNNVDILEQHLKHVKEHVENGFEINGPSQIHTIEVEQLITFQLAELLQIINLIECKVLYLTNFVQYESLTDVTNLEYPTTGSSLEVFHMTIEYHDLNVKILRQHANTLKKVIICFSVFSDDQVSFVNALKHLNSECEIVIKLHVDPDDCEFSICNYTCNSYYENVFRAINPTINVVCYKHCVY